MILQYFYHLLRNPNRADFLDMGYGIAARYRRCATAWAPHLRCCHELQSKTVSKLDAGGAVAILGSGRMYDLAWDELVKKFDRIDCYDADPAVKSVFSRQKQKSNVDGDFYCRDLTGCIDTWSTKLGELLRTKPSVEQVATMLRSLRAPLQSLERQYKLVISLNLLSQIPIYWRDRVQAAVLRYLRLDTDENGRYESLLQEALEHSCRVLEESHLELLRSCNAEKIIIITDIERMYYKPDVSNWSCEPALVSSDIPELQSGERWFWHIAPALQEGLGYGIIHLVHGVEITPGRLTTTMPQS